MKSLITNKKALMQYEVQDTFEAGIELHGFEVKAIQSGSGSLRGAFVIIQDEEAFLKGMSIPPLQPKNTVASYDSARTRKLLLHKKEIQKLIGLTNQKGLTLIPTKLYSNGKHIKVEVILAKNKSKRDKRQDIKKREDNRDIARTLKQYR